MYSQDKEISAHLLLLHTPYVCAPFRHSREPRLPSKKKMPTPTPESIHFHPQIVSSTGLQPNGRCSPLAYRPMSTQSYHKLGAPAELLNRSDHLLR